MPKGDLEWLPYRRKSRSVLSLALNAISPSWPLRRLATLAKQIPSRSSRTCWPTYSAEAKEAKGTEAEVSPRISSLNQQLARGLREQCAHDAVIPHGLRSQRRPHHARDQSIAKVPGRCTAADACAAPSCVVACRGSVDPWPSSDPDRCRSRMA